MILVWKLLARSGSACMMHCTSTTMASTAPVMMASSWLRKLPAEGMPWRIKRLVGGAADAAQVDALGALALGILDQLRILDGGDDHLGERRLVAVDDDVDLVRLEHAQVDLGDHRAWRAEEDVRDVGRQHAAAPAVGQGGAQGCAQDVLGVLVVAHVGAVQDLDHLAVDAARRDAQLAPDLLALLGRALDVDQLALLLAELGDGDVGDVEGDIVDRLAPRS